MITYNISAYLQKSLWKTTTMHNASENPKYFQWWILFSDGTRELFSKKLLSMSILGRTWNYFMKYSLILCSPDNTPNRKRPVYLLFLGWSDIHPVIPWLSSSMIFGNVSLGLKHSVDFPWYPLARWSHDLIYA